LPEERGRPLRRAVALPPLEGGVLAGRDGVEAGGGGQPARSQGPEEGALAADREGADRRLRRLGDGQRRDPPGAARAAVELGQVHEEVDTPWGYGRVAAMEASADAHDHQHELPTDGSALTGLAISATLHCLTGCAIGEIAGMVIGTALGFSQ